MLRPGPLKPTVQVCVWNLVALFSTFAQDQDANRVSPALPSRAAEIEQQRARKAAGLEPDQQQGIERVLQTIEDDRVLQRIFGGMEGVRLRLGGLITNSGLAFGPEYSHRAWHDRLRLRASVRGSLKEFYLMEAEADMPALTGGRAFLNLYAVRQDYPRVDYYGSGPHSQKSGRSSFRLENTSFQALAGVHPLHRLRTGVLGRYILVNVGPGTNDDGIAQTDRTYTEQSTPGLEYQTNYFQTGAFAQYDWRDRPGNPHAGGNYQANFSVFNDVRRGRYDFNRLDLEAQQYVPFFNRRRVIALRARVAATGVHSGNLTPFYMQPTLGGPDDLRGYRPFRFYGNTSLLLNGEYRWQVFNGLDMALFADAGRVFDQWRQVELRHLESDYGFGFRFNTAAAVAIRIDAGFSHEGFGVWLKFNNVF